MKTRAILFLTAAIIGCSGCASVHVPLKQEDARQITETRLHAVVVQEEIAAEVEKSNISTYTGGGLIPALIDLAVESHRAHSANDLLEPIRKAGTGFDFRKELDSQLQEMRIGGGVLKLSESIVTAKPLNDEERLALLKETTRNSLLELDVKYRLTADFKTLSVVNTAKLWMKGREEPIYANTFTYRSPPIGNMEKDEAAAAWAANDATLLRKTLHEAVAEITRMLALDFSNQNPPAASK